MALKQKQPSKVFGFAGIFGAGKNSWAGYLQFYRAIKCLALGWVLQFFPAKTLALLLVPNTFYQRKISFYYADLEHLPLRVRRHFAVQPADLSRKLCHLKQCIL